MISTSFAWAAKSSIPWAQEAKPGDVVSVLDLDENDKETIRREIQKEVEMHLAELERLKVIL